MQQYAKQLLLHCFYMFFLMGQNCQKLQTQLTCGTSMKLGLAVEIKPKVLMVQFTNWERMSHAASADSVQLST